MGLLCFVPVLFCKVVSLLLLDRLKVLWSATMAFPVYPYICFLLTPLTDWTKCLIIVYIDLYLIRYIDSKRTFGSSLGAFRIATDAQFIHTDSEECDLNVCFLTLRFIVSGRVGRCYCYIWQIVLSLYQTLIREYNQNCADIYGLSVYECLLMTVWS